MEWAGLTAEVKNMLSQLPLGICVMGSDGLIQWANPSFYEQLGVSQQDTQDIALSELPMKLADGLGHGIYQPIHHTDKRLRVATVACGNDHEVALFTDVSDLVSDIGGYADLLLEMARMDANTGLLTPASMYRELFEQVSRSRRYGNALAIVRIDIGGLRKDDISNQEREQTLRDFGIKLADNVRNIDFAGRLSDYEFLMVLPETDPKGVKILIDKLEPMLGAAQITTQSGQAADLEIKIGFAQWTATDDASTLLEKARPNTTT
jgi:diguanylate cyclase (GGDEF)-like protein